MHHYEIVLLIHPDQSDQVGGTIERYTSLVKNSGGIIHRLENWGRRQLAYSINKLRKAHYILMNVECSPSVVDELTHAFRFNDAIMRHFIMKVSHAITEPSPLLKSKEASGE